MTDSEMQAFITRTILERISGQGERRNEALRAVFALASPQLDKTALNALAWNTPELPPVLYKKWADMFAGRMLETVDRNVLAELCSGTEENTASLLLLYVMFMESERMEKQVALDVQALAEQDGTPGH